MAQVKKTSQNLWMLTAALARGVVSMVPIEEKSSRVILAWDEESPEEIAAAEKTFREYIRKGWLAFEVTADNKKKQTFSFDTSANQIHLVRLVEGG